MQRGSQKHPAGTYTREADSYPFIGSWKLKAGLRSSGLELCQYTGAIAVEILCKNRKTYFTVGIFGAETGNEMINSFSFTFRFSDGNHQFDSQISAVIQIIILFQAAVTGSLHSQWAYNAFGIEFLTFVDYIFVTAHIRQMLQTKLIFKKVSQTVGSNGIRDNGAARIIRRQNSCNHGDNGITVDRCAIGQYSRHTIYIRIKDQTKVSTSSNGCVTDGFHSVFVFRVWNMIWEHTVRIKEIASDCVCTQFI